MPQRILITANQDLAAIFFQFMRGREFLHIPLEYFEGAANAGEVEQIKKTIQDYAFIIHGNRRNARFFTELMNENSLMEEAKNRVNLAVDRPTADFLEKEQIPAILPRENGKPIDVMEFMLRISKEGKTLYPSIKNETEEIPALLKELEMPVKEFPVCREMTIPVPELKNYRKQIQNEKFDTILIHNRSSLIRIKTAFPNLDLSNFKLVAGSPGVAEKLREEGCEPFFQASGTWHSIAKVVGDLH